MRRGKTWFVRVAGCSAWSLGDGRLLLLLVRRPAITKKLSVLCRWILIGALLPVRRPATTKKLSCSLQINLNQSVVAGRLTSNASNLVHLNHSFQPISYPMHLSSSHYHTGRPHKCKFVILQFLFSFLRHCCKRLSCNRNRQNKVPKQGG